MNPRHNTGLENKGYYLTMAQVLAVKNRVPSAHLRYYHLKICTKTQVSEINKTKDVSNWFGLGYERWPFETV